MLAGVSTKSCVEQAVICDARLTRIGGWGGGGVLNLRITCHYHIIKMSTTKKSTQNWEHDIACDAGSGVFYTGSGAYGKSMQRLKQQQVQTYASTQADVLWHTYSCTSPHTHMMGNIKKFFVVSLTVTIHHSCKCIAKEQVWYQGCNSVAVKKTPLNCAPFYFQKLSMVTSF